MKTSDIKEHFIKELQAGNITVDRTGAKTIEMLGASFVADKPAIFGTPNAAYIDAEIKWYKSQSLNVNDMPLKEVPEAWKHTANQRGFVNSNYGYLIFGNEYMAQYNCALQELLTNTSSRRATMIYTRPHIWIDYKADGKNDFICTNAVTYYIRNTQVHAVVQMRSNDVVYGYKNDYAWQRYVQLKLVDDLYKSTGIEYTSGDIIWQVQNLHVYERHFKLVS